MFLQIIPTRTSVTTLLFCISVAKVETRWSVEGAWYSHKSHHTRVEVLRFMIKGLKTRPSLWEKLYPRFLPFIAANIIASTHPRTPGKHSDDYWATRLAQAKLEGFERRVCFKHCGEPSPSPSPCLRSKSVLNPRKSRGSIHSIWYPPPSYLFACEIISTSAFFRALACAAACMQHHDGLWGAGFGFSFAILGSIDVAHFTALTTRQLEIKDVPSGHSVRWSPISLSSIITSRCPSPI